MLRPGGVLVLHLLNHARLLGGKPRVIPPIVREVPEGTRVFLRVIDYPAGDEFLDFDFVTLTRDADGAWDVASRRSPHTALPLGLLSAELADAGFERIEAFGAHDGRAFDADKDESVIVVARRTAEVGVAEDPAVISRPRTPGAVPDGRCVRAPRRRPRRARSAASR